MVLADGVDVVEHMVAHASKVRLHYLLRVDGDGPLAVAKIRPGDEPPGADDLHVVERRGAVGVEDQIHAEAIDADGCHTLDRQPLPSLPAAVLIDRAVADPASFAVRVEVFQAEVSSPTTRDVLGANPNAGLELVAVGDAGRSRTATSAIVGPCPAPR